jgi:hypothetical protein
MIDNGEISCLNARCKKLPQNCILQVLVLVVGSTAKVSDHLQLVSQYVPFTV